jgi:hypothetical protein
MSVHISTLSVCLPMGFKGIYVLNSVSYCIIFKPVTKPVYEEKNLQSM